MEINNSLDVKSKTINNIKLSECVVKKNIEIIKNTKPKIISIKKDTFDKMSMEESLQNNKVLLWGINTIDSILLKKYENNINLKKKKITLP